jgi:hypothetical protein
MPKANSKLAALLKKHVDFFIMTYGKFNGELSQSFFKKLSIIVFQTRNVADPGS